MSQIRVKAEDMEGEFFRILTSRGFVEEKARLCAKVFTDNSLEGVYTHGVNRFPRFIEYVDAGFVKPCEEATLAHSSGAIEQWDGRFGAGPVNAIKCTDRALVLSDQFGVGCVALSHTNHWMRGGAYGWRAAKAGYGFIAWTNTTANTPAWGSIEPRLGNNPLIMAIPYEGEAVVLDMAMSQYSYGAMELYRMRGEKLPVPGGYDQEGNLSDDPARVLATRRALPVGYWKGSALSLLLDLLATILGGGQSTAGISRLPEESDVSQVFIAFNLSRLSHAGAIPSLVRQVIDDYAQSATESGSGRLRYPGEKAVRLREDNSVNGIPVEDSIWQSIRVQ